jgi:hypothetical protein
MIARHGRPEGLPDLVRERDRIVRFRAGEANANDCGEQAAVTVELA